MPRAGDRFKRANIGKSDNTAEAERAKITIRRNVLAEVGAEHASVFDAFAGEGRMHAAVWHEAARYIGCDTRFFTDYRPAFVADNRRVLRAIDLAAFNLFDLDFDGSPWEQAYIIARRRKLRPGERLGLVLTEGTGLASKLNTMSAAMALLAGNTHAYHRASAHARQHHRPRAASGCHDDGRNNQAALAGERLLWQPHDVHRSRDRW